MLYLEILYPIKVRIRNFEGNEKEIFCRFFLNTSPEMEFLSILNNSYSPSSFCLGFFFSSVLFYAFSAYPVNDLKRHFKRSEISALGLCFQSIQAILDWNFLEYLSREKKYFFEQIVE